MPTKLLDRLLAELEEAKTRFSPGDDRRIVRLLAALGRQNLEDAASLIRFHEALLFLRAFPHSPTALRRVEQLLNSFVARVQALRSARADLSPLEPLEVSGIAGTAIEDTLSYDVVRWLAPRFPDRVEIVWDGYEEERLMANAWPRFIPLLREDSDVEANIPWREWLRAAKGGKGSSDILWFLRQFEHLPLLPEQKSELYDGLQMPVRWELGNLRASRTRNWRRPRTIYYHRAPLTRRSEVSLQAEFESSPLPIRKLSRAEGAATLDLVREVMAVRYRELYGTTLGDSRRVLRADLGRGVEVFLWGLPPGRRLPLRSYLAGMTLKNGVPISYIEAITLFEWTEVGFNTFYTFRDGETAWIYAKVLHLLQQLHNVRCISVYPYQIGLNNEEAIESGAFWFYRKLGFRPGRPDLERLAQAEEKKIAARPGYRTATRTLRRLAQGHVFYELPGADARAWDRFSTRNLGLAVNRRIAEMFAGDSQRMREICAPAVAKALRVRVSNLNDLERRSFENFALVLSLIPGLARWSPAEKRGLLALVRAKVADDELRYVQRLQQQPRLRASLLKLGTSTSMAPE